MTGVLALSAAYKYAVLQLETDPGVPPLRLAGDGPTDDPGVQRSLNIVRHPLSGPKALAIRNNVTTELSERPDELGYLTATATSPGARGAPVFDDEWRVVAMHQAGEQAAKTAPARVHDSGRFGESITELRKKVNSIAKSYEAGESFWVWDKDQLHDEIYRIQQQLDALCDSLPTAEDDDSGLRQALDRHGSAANRFDEILQQLQVGTSAAQRSAWSSEFKRRGTTWLDDLARLQGALPGAGYRLTGPD